MTQRLKTKKKVSSNLLRQCKSKKKKMKIKSLRLEIILMFPVKIVIQPIDYC